MMETRIPIRFFQCGTILALLLFYHAATTRAMSPSNQANVARDTYKNAPPTSNTRRDVLRTAGLTASGLVSSAFLSSSSSGVANANANAAILEEVDITKRSYFQRFPTLFAPLYGDATRETIKRQVGENIWALEQNLELGPLETPLRCVVIRLNDDDGTLWVHAPLAPTEEFFQLVESCGGKVGHVVVPTYALEHKIFVKDALLRWPNAKLWTAPGQFSFPKKNMADDFIWGKSVDGVLYGSDETMTTSAPWTNEIQYETLAAGTFLIGSSPQTFYETAFFHKSSKTLIVTDSVVQIPLAPPPLNHADKLLLVSKRSTSDPQPDDTPEARQVGWEKTSLLVSYFFPEHEELDPDAGFGVVTWTDGWHNNFNALAGRLLVPPVVRTLLYAQNPNEVQRWVDRVVARWEFQQIVPAHFEAPISASRVEFRKAFLFLQEITIDPFPANDLARGLKPIADIALKRL
jgi:hypothetical protein